MHGDTFSSLYGTVVRINRLVYFTMVCHYPQNSNILKNYVGVHLIGTAKHGKNKKAQSKIHQHFCFVKMLNSSHFIKLKEMVFS